MQHTHACVVWWCNSTDLTVNYMYTQRRNGINSGIQDTYHRLSYTVCWQHCVCVCVCVCVSVDEIINLLCIQFTFLAGGREVTCSCLHSWEEDYNLHMHCMCCVLCQSKKFTQLQLPLMAVVGQQCYLQHFHHISVHIQGWYECFNQTSFTCTKVLSNTSLYNSILIISTILSFLHLITL